MSFTAIATWFNLPIIKASQSNFDDKNVHARLLAPCGIDGVAHGPFDGAGKRIGIAAFRPRQIVECLEDRRVDDLIHAVAAARLLRQTHDNNIRIAGKLALSGHGEGDGDHTGEGQFATLSDAIISCLEYDLAVLVATSRFNLADHACL